jgi:ADP-ribose pyrophosphatase
VTGHSYDVVGSELRFTGPVISVRSDTVVMPGGGTSVRDVITHPGAVAVLAMDDAGRVMLIRQYRHPVGDYLWELPAGLLDDDAESSLDAARRELLEEVGVAAGDWRVLVDVHTTPGSTDEAVRIYLARGLSDKVADFTPGEHEESDLTEEWVDLDEALARVLAGDITNGLTVAGVLAAAHARGSSYRGLRPADAPWPARRP